MAKGTASPAETYTALAYKVRSRIEFAEKILTLNVPSSQKVETVSLQGRKIIESIAYMVLVAIHERHGLKGLPRDAKAHWNAETILNRLKQKKLLALPSPSIAKRSTDPRFKLTFEGVPAFRLTHDDLIGIYRSFHKGLHEPNPYVQDDEDSFYKNLIPSLREDLARIRNFIWSHMMSIQGRGFMVVFRDDNGNMAVNSMVQAGPIPPDLL